MSGFERVLFSSLETTGSTGAIRQLQQITGVEVSNLTLLGVVSHPPWTARVLHTEIWADELIARVEETQRRKLTHLATRASISEAAIEVATGSTADAIAEHALTHEHDLVVVESNEEADDAVTIRRLLRDCPCPVWVLRPYRAQGARILAAVSTDPDEDELNRRVLGLAASLCDESGGELHIAHAWDFYGEASLRSASFIGTTSADVDRMIGEELAAHRHAVHKLTSGIAPGQDWHVHMRRGEANHVLPELVRSQRITHLVVGTMARHGLSGLVVGNTAERLLDNVGCSILVTR